MADNKKVLTTENLVAIKELNDELYQEKLESGETIKTINGQSLLGSGDIKVAAEVEELKIKTVNGQSLLGTGNVTIETFNVALLAPAWSAGYDYEVGDLISKGTKLYECVEDHQSSNNFNNDVNYWQETNIAESIVGLLNREM